MEARYWGESGFSGYCRTLEHIKPIENKDGKNAFGKHLAIHHPGEEGNVEAFKFTLAETHKQPLPRLVSESCYIHGNSIEVLMNSKAECHEPAVGRAVVTQELQELAGQD